MYIILYFQIIFIFLFFLFFSLSLSSLRFLFHSCSPNQVPNPTGAPKHPTLSVPPSSSPTLVPTSSLAIQRPVPISEI